MTEPMLTLKRTYGAMCSPSTLPHSLIKRSDSALLQEELVNEILLSSHFQAFPPSREYRRQFWKWIVEGLESQGEEVDERIYEVYLELLSTPTPPSVSRPPSPSYNTYLWSPHITPRKCEPSRLTTLLQSRMMIEGGTTGLRTWGASLRLGDWLVLHPEVVQSRRILELGSGVGFLGLIIAALQLETCHIKPHTPSLVLTDANSEVLSRCRDNIMLPCNDMHGHPSLDFRLLDWSDALDGQGQIDFSISTTNEILTNTDIIIGADLVYDVTIIPALVAVLALFFRIKCQLASRNDNCRETSGAYIALTIRREDTFSKFLDHLASHCLRYDVLDLDFDSGAQFLGGREMIGVGNNIKLVRIFGACSPPLRADNESLQLPSKGDADK